MFKRIIVYTLLALGIFSTFFGKDIAVEASRIVLAKEYYSPPTGYERMSEMHSDIAYNALDENLKEPYKRLLDSYLRFVPSVKVSGIEEQDIRRIYDAVKSDYPLLFWVSDGAGYEQAKFSKKFTINTEMTFKRRESNYMLAEIEAAIKIISSGVDPSWSDIQKAEYLYTQIVRTVTYDETASHHRDVYGAFVEKRATCVGYSRAYQLLLAYNGIDSNQATGYSKESNIGHAWNIVKLDGKYYYSDVTNGELVSSVNAELISDFKTEVVRYEYMFMDKETVEMTTNFDKVQVYGDIECNSLDGNYFTRNGLVVETANVTDIVDTIYDSLQAEVSKNESTFQFKFATKELLLQFEEENFYQGSPFFTTIMNRLLNNREISGVTILDIGTNVMMIIFIYN